MEFMTTKEAVEKWNISERRIRQLLQDGRIEGAVKVGNSWNIPIDADKPVDKRIIKPDDNNFIIDLDDNYFDIVKHLTNFDCFMNIPSISSGAITNEDLLEYVNKSINRVPLFFDVVIHVDKTCLENDPDFNTRFSKDVFSCVVQIVKHIVPYNEVSDIAECLFEALKPVLNKYQEAKLKYFD